MSNFRAVDTLIGAGVLGTLLLGGFAASQAYLAKNILDSWGTKTGSGTTNSPLKIRGGAMTFSSSSSFGSDSAGNKCVQLKGKYIELFNVVNMSNNTSVAFMPYPNDVNDVVDANWQIDIYGRDPSGRAESPHGSGIRLTVTTACTVGTSTKAGVSLVPEESTYSSLYLNTTSLNDGGTVDLRRYRDSFCQSTSPTTDEDSCEHIYDIFINKAHQSSITAVKANAIGSFLCSNGDCTIGIGLVKP